MIIWNNAKRLGVIFEIMKVYFVLEDVDGLSKKDRDEVMAMLDDVYQLLREGIPEGDFLAYLDKRLAPYT